MKSVGRALVVVAACATGLWPALTSRADGADEPGPYQEVLPEKPAIFECDPFHNSVLHRVELKKARRTREARETLPPISHADCEKSGIMVRDPRDAVPANANQLPDMGVGLT